MLDEVIDPSRCRRCNELLGSHRITVTESEGETEAIREWVLCSWDCAREHTIRKARCEHEVS